MTSAILAQSQDLPDPPTVSSSIQQMWALTEVMQTQQTTASVGRFDVSLLDFLWTVDQLTRPCGGNADELSCQHGRVSEGPLPLLSQVDGCYNLNLVSLT